MNDENEVTSRSLVTTSVFTHIVPEMKNKVTTRWSPTAEQLMGLEELYRHGTRTPTALQIQEITAKLRRFGNIEGKNVFYWFQNHKARDKKKQRLKLEAQRRHLFDHNFSKTKPSVLSQKVTTLNVQNTKPEPLSNCSTISEESGTAVPRATLHRRWIKADHEELKLIKSEEEKHYVSPLKPFMEIPFCFPIINLNHNNNNNYYYYGNNNIGESEHEIETLVLFPLHTESLGVAKYENHRHDYDHGAANCDLSLI